MFAMERTKNLVNAGKPPPAIRPGDQPILETCWVQKLHWD